MSSSNYGDVRIGRDALRYVWEAFRQGGGLHQFPFDAALFVLGSGRLIVSRSSKLPQPRLQRILLLSMASS